MNWQSAVERTVSGLGYELVEMERGARGLLRVCIDHLPEVAPAKSVTVDDCEKVTRQLQHVLEVEGCAYERLEVSSPGLDRPLRKKADYDRFLGQEIELQLKEAFEGRKKFQGMLLAADEDAVAHASQPAEEEGGASWRLVFTQGKSSQVLVFSLHEVREARLVPVIDFKGRRFAASPAESNGEDKKDGDRHE